MLNQGTESQNSSNFQQLATISYIPSSYPVTLVMEDDEMAPLEFNHAPQCYKWTDEDTARLITWRAQNDAVFTGRRNAALRGFELFINHYDMEGKVQAGWLKKKWENLKQKYKEMKALRAVAANEGREPPPPNWKWFGIMEETVGHRTPIVHPNLIAIKREKRQSLVSKRRPEADFLPFMKELLEKEEERARIAEVRAEDREREVEEREDRRERERREEERERREEERQQNERREREFREWMEARSREERRERDTREREHREREEERERIAEAKAEKRDREALEREERRDRERREEERERREEERRENERRDREFREWMEARSREERAEKEEREKEYREREERRDRESRLREERLLLILQSFMAKK